MTATSRIRRQGGAAVVTIPPALLKLMGAEIGQQLALRVVDGELVARPEKASRKRYTLAELLRGSENVARLNEETEWAREGEPVGRELS